LPVCVGIGPSKTLSKLANPVAKMRPEWHGVSVFLQTNRFKPDEPQPPPCVTAPLAVASADTLTQAALAGLRRIYRTGFTYQKAG